MKLKNYFFLLSIFLSFQTFSDTTGDKIDFIEILENKDKIATITDDFFKNFESGIHHDSFFGEFIIVFDKKFQNLNISLYNKKYILDEGFKNFFIPPNIIHISSEHNKSFAYTLYTQRNYTDVVKKYSSHMLLFHELSHLYFYNKKMGDNKIFEEAFCDISSILMIKKLYNLNNDELFEIINSLIDYRKLYKYYNSISEQILPFVYLDIVHNKIEFKDLNSIFDYSNKKSQHFIFKKYSNFKGDFIDLEEFSNMIADEKIDIYNLKERELKLIIEDYN